MTGTYRIAGLNICITTIHDGFHVYSEDYSVDGDAYDFDVQTSQEDIDVERSKSKDFSPPDAYLEAVAVFRKISERMPEYDTLLFHGSAVSVDGLGYIFAAPSGTGKSTHTAMWCEILGECAVMVNDDKPMIRVGTAGAEVFGTPFNGKHSRGNNIHVPLRAVCILERGETNHIERINGDVAYSSLIRQTYRPYNSVMLAKTLSLLDRLKNSMSFYRLYCNMNSEAARVSWEAMRP